jgi:hypothetical protein
MTKEKKEKFEYEKPSLNHLDQVAQGVPTCGGGASATITCGPDGGAATVTCTGGGGDT